MRAEAVEIWAILREVAEGQKENTEQIRLLGESQKETERIIEKLQRETAKEIQEARQNAEQLHRQTTKEIQEARQNAEQLHRQTAKEIQDVNRSIGRLTNRLGEFVEEAVRPAAVKLFRERGIDVHEVHQNISVKRDGEGLEVDLLVVNNDDAVVIECKSNLSIDDVNDHLKRLEKMKRLMPHYRGYRILGAVAGMVIPENVAMYAIRKGLYVIGQTGEHLALRNDESFTAMIW
jgi:hypothetical protein